MIEWLKDFFGIFPTFGGVPRSPKWSGVRKQHLALYPLCTVCETKDGCEVHHKAPYHLHPDLELDPRNLITLCRDHHLLFGHLMSFKSYNQDVEVDATTWRLKIKERP